MDDILKVFSTIMQDPNLQKELAKKETIEDMYDYCISISGGYTIEQFKEFLHELFKIIDKMPEKQLEKVSGGIKLNNKALSTMLATMAIASPLAGAAGTKGEANATQQPSKVSSFVKNIKDKVLKHPAETALGGVATIGGAALLVFKTFGKSPDTKNNATDAATGNAARVPARVPIVAPRANAQAIPLLSTNPGENMNQDTIDLFQADGISRIVNHHTFQTFRDLKQSFLNRHLDGVVRFGGTRFINAVKQIVGSLHLQNVNENILEPQNINVTGVRIYNNTNNQLIDLRDILTMDTENINNLAYIGLELLTSERQSNGRSLNGHHQINMVNNSQKAFVIRYIQLAYVQYMQS